MSITSIEWTDRTWNPTTGCTWASPGCDHCYAAAMTRRLEAMGQADYSGLTSAKHFNGTVRTLPHRLTDPLKWKKPQRIFVNSMSDLFHKDVPFAFIDQVFAVMALCPQHTFQILTKRPERMAEYLNSEDIQHRVAKAMNTIEVASEIASLTEEWRQVAGRIGYEVSNLGRVRGPRGVLAGDVGEHGHTRVTMHGGDRSRALVHHLVLTAFDRPPVDGEQGMHTNGDPTCNALPNLRWGTQSDNWQDRKRHGNHRSNCKLSKDRVNEIRKRMAAGGVGERLAVEYGVSATQIRNIADGKQWVTDAGIVWPLPEVWLGTSVENQAAADTRIPHLLRCPAAVRFLSAEPLLGPVDLTNYIGYNPTYESKEPRAGTVRSRGDGHLKNRLNGSNLEDPRAARESMERKGVTTGSEAQESRESHRPVPANQVDEGWRENPLPCAPAGVVPLQRPDTRGNAGQSQEFRQNGQSPVEHGTVNCKREPEARLPSRHEEPNGPAQSGSEANRLTGSCDSDDVRVGVQNTVANREAISRVTPNSLKDSAWRSKGLSTRAYERLHESSYPSGQGSQPARSIHLVIVGGESGPGARPMHPQWVRSIRDQCQAAGVPFFFKQWGEWYPNSQHKLVPCGKFPSINSATEWLRDAQGSPEYYRVGKKAAGRLLDGREWNEMPARQEPRT